MEQYRRKEADKAWSETKGSFPLTCYLRLEKPTDTVVEACLFRGVNCFLCPVTITDNFYYLEPFQLAQQMENNGWSEKIYQFFKKRFKNVCVISSLPERAA
jgi:hypothetical protein